jgi:hypothetical protein
MRRPITGVCLFLLLSGCGMARQKEAQDRLNEALAQVRSATDACNLSFPRQQQSTAVARSQCIGQATLPLRPFVPFPDLFDQEAANRNLLAERWQGGKITIAEFDAQGAQMHSQIVAEEQRRQLAGRSVSAQETAAAAAVNASGPTVCTRSGNTTFCN